MGIWAAGKTWSVNKYNKRLSEENQVDDEIDKKIRALKKEIRKLNEERDEKLDEIWK